MLLKRTICMILAVFALSVTAFAGMPGSAEATGQGERESAFDFDEQFDALGRDELMREVPQQAKSFMRETGTYELSIKSLLQLSPRDFFKAIWGALLDSLKKPVRTIAAVVGIIVLCALIGGLKTASGENSLSQIFTSVSVLCVITSVITPIFDCVVATSNAIQDAALFMLSFIPMLSAAMTASGSPITGAAYNLFLFSACQIVSQVVAKTLIPLIGVYIAMCVIGTLIPDINIASATTTIKSIISWVLGFFLTVFVGLLSVQTMVSHSADTVTIRATKFMIGSFVPVVGSALSDAFSAAQGCFRLLKTTLGAYGIIVAGFTFLPALLQTVAWYALTNLAVVAGDIIGVPRVSAVLKSCASALGILIAILLCFALLVIVSTTIVMVMGLGTA